MNRSHGNALSLMACVVAVSVSGCMIGPTQGEHIGSSHNQIHPAGFVLDGNMLIEVQAFDRGTSSWVTLATTRSKTGSIAWEGYDWHYWQSPPITISPRWWASDGFEPTGEDPHHKVARLRALADGKPIHTFNEWNFGSLGDMVSEVHGTDVRVYATDIYID